MNLLETILQAGDGKLVDQMANQFGLDKQQANGAIGALLPALTKGMSKGGASGGGLDSLIGALQKGNHSRYLDDLSSLSLDDTANDGNSILGHIFGSKDVSRNVAAHAAESSGVDSSILKKMLPVLAAAAMGAMSKKVGGADGLSGLTGGDSSAGSSLISSFLDADGDGSVVDDVLGMAKRFF